MDNLARALLMRGARDAAVMLLKAASRRGGDEKARCEALLAAIQARPTDRVSGPPLSLDAELVEAVAASGRLVEARAIALGADLARNVAGVEIAAALDEVFSGSEAWPPAFRVQWDDALASGQLSAMVALDREASVAADVAPALRSRVSVALRLLRGFSLTGATHVRDPMGELELPSLSDAARDRIVARIAASDLSGALQAAHAMAFEGIVGAGELAVVLGRLVAAADRAMAEQPALGAKMAATMPLGGPGMALFQLRMGNLTEAQRLFRAMLAEAPSDYVAREHLTDLVALERALGIGSTARSALPEPPSRAPTTDWLDKKARKGSMEGWAASPKPAPVTAAAPDASWDDDADSTSVMKSDHEAELMLKSGHPERAVALYAMLVKQFPAQRRFADRKAEIEAMLVARVAPMAMEPTVRRDLPVEPRAVPETPASPEAEKELDPLAETGRDGTPSPGEFEVSTEVMRLPGRGAGAVRGWGLGPKAAAAAPVAEPASAAPPVVPAVEPPTARASGPAVPASRPLSPGGRGSVPPSRPALRAQGSAPSAVPPDASVHRAADLSGSASAPSDLPGVVTRRIVSVQ